MYRIVVARTTEDFKNIRKLDKKCFPLDTPVNINNAIYFLAIDENSVPVAFGGIVMVANAWYLRRAGVIKAARGQGLQKRLILARIKFAMKYRPDYSVIAYTVHDNIPSQRSLIDCGFKTFVPTELYGGSTSIYWIYERKQDEKRT
jgi:GNAT superfamily N-acetyltransferase